MKIYRVKYYGYEYTYNEWFFADRDQADQFFQEILDDKVPKKRTGINDEKEFNRKELVGEEGDRCLKKAKLTGEFLRLEPVVVNMIEDVQDDRVESAETEIDIEGERYADSIDEVGK